MASKQTDSTPFNTAPHLPGSSLRHRLAAPLAGRVARGAIVDSAQQAPTIGARPLIQTPRQRTWPRPASGAAKRQGLKAIQPRAFTLVEMLVVIGIIVLLIGIAAPMLNRAWKNAVRTRMAGDLQAISAGLEAYRQDFKDYPRMDYSPTKAFNNPNNGGAILLCWALIAPGADIQDGADGQGFRVRSFQPTGGGASTGQGQLYGPYVAPGRLIIGNGTDDPTSTINDRYGHPYLYFPANRAQLPATAYMQQWPPGGNPIPMFNATDNLGVFAHIGDASGSYGLYRIQAMLGDTGNGTAGSTTPDGKIDGNEIANSTGSYILWGAGPDEQYGPNFIGNATAPPFDLSNCDDVTNFQ